MTQYTPEMRLLHRDMRRLITKFMNRRERQGAAYVEAAIDASAILGEELSTLFGCIEAAEQRDTIVEKFCRHLPGSVAKANALAERARSGGSIQ